MRLAIVLFLVQIAGAQARRSAVASPQGEVTPTEEQQLREAGKQMPKAELDKLIAEIKARRDRELHPTFFTKVEDAAPRLGIRIYGLAVYLLLVLGPVAAIWALKNRQYQTFLAALSSVGLFARVIPGGGTSPFAQLILLVAAFGGAAMAIPLSIRLFALKSVDAVLDSLVFAGVIIAAGSLARSSLVGDVYALDAFMLAVVWGEGRAAFLVIRKKNAAAAHCIACAAVAACLASFLSLGFMGL